MKAFNGVCFSLVLVLTIAAGMSVFSVPCHASLVKADKVLVMKGERTMLLMKGDEVIKSYKVALGRNPIGHKVRM
jgi:hypothetical protein